MPDVRFKKDEPCFKQAGISFLRLWKCQYCDKQTSQSPHNKDGKEVNHPDVVGPVLDGEKVDRANH